jgi:sialic acid synthase SpsE/sugar phosphate isomerase/epimerase
MNIQRDLKSLTILPEESVINALQKMCQTGSRVVLLTREDGILDGIFTDGDLRQWLARQKDADLNRPVSEAANREFVSARISESPERIARLFRETIRFVPLLDARGRLVALAINEDAKFTIGEFSINSTGPAFVIAEIGNNHNGQIEMARKLVDHAVLAGANCAKFQIRHMQTLYRETGLEGAADEDLGTQYVLDLLAKHQLTDEQLFEVFDYSKAAGIEPLCTPWDLSSLAALERYGMNAYKVASADLTNHELLESLALTGKPLLVSTGMSTEEEIIQAIKLLNRFSAPYLLLHCNSAYPAPFADINLHYMDRLRELSGRLVGYSGHERGFHVTIAAVALGARVIEKHITLDRSLEGSDHKVSLLPTEFADMVRSIRQVEQSLGLGGERKLSQGEIINRNSLAKSLVASRHISAGETISADAVSVRSPGRGLQPNARKQLIGRKAKRSFNAGDFFYPSDLQDESLQARHYQFRRPWGVPVRYHDFRQIVANTNPDLLEFHLSYKDLDLDFKSYLFEPQEGRELIIHAPELFAGDHLLDLCSEDISYRNHSIAEMQRVIDLTRSLHPLFPKTKLPLIVTNVGGFSLDNVLCYQEISSKEDCLADSISRLDQEGVEIIAQTMPPYPWHFGGQSHHNIFVDPQQIVSLCRRLNLRICLDVSHSKLACNYLKQSFKLFVDLVGPYAAHLHIADAAGEDGEGLQIGDGEIDFTALAEDLDRTCPNASFIPEIWQGHNNDGEGFWHALSRLEGTL